MSWQKELSKYEIRESHKYEGCYNIYEVKTGNRVHYFAEDDNKNKERAMKWVKEKKNREQP